MQTMDGTDKLLDLDDLDAFFCGTGLKSGCCFFFSTKCSDKTKKLGAVPKLVLASKRSYVNGLNPKPLISVFFFETQTVDISLQ